MEKFKYLNLDYPSGCILAKAIITDCIPIDVAARKMLKEKDAIVYNRVIKDTDWDGYGFKLEDVKEIEPILVNGKLSLWDYEGEIYEKSKSRN